MYTRHVGVCSGAGYQSVLVGREEGGARRRIFLIYMQRRGVAKHVPRPLQLLSYRVQL